MSTIREWIAAQKLQADNIFCLRAFGALGNRKFYGLTFSQRLEAAASNVAEVSKNIGAGFLCDETKTFGLIKPLNGTGSCIRHNKYPE